MKARRWDRGSHSAAKGRAFVAAAIGRRRPVQARMPSSKPVRGGVVPPAPPSVPTIASSKFEFLAKQPQKSLYKTQTYKLIKQFVHNCTKCINRNQGDNDKTPGRVPLVHWCSKCKSQGTNFRYPYKRASSGFAIRSQGGKGFEQRTEGLRECARATGETGRIMAHPYNKTGRICGPEQVLF
jgi:hypothetical protein